MATTQRVHVSETLVLSNTGLDDNRHQPIHAPANLKYLFICNNDLTVIPCELPDTLQLLNCSSNLITALPTRLPTHLTELYCQSNKLVKLPEQLPEGLQILNCSSNHLELLSELPEGLQILNCSSNQLKKLPMLPQSLKILHCSGNPQLSTAYPLLQDMLKEKVYDDYNDSVVKILHIKEIIAYVNMINTGLVNQNDCA